MAKKKQTFSEAALEAIRGRGLNFLDRAIEAAKWQFGTSGDLPKFGKGTTASVELDAIHAGVIEDGKSEQTANNRKSQFRKVLRSYPVLKRAIELCREATMPTTIEKKVRGKVKEVAVDPLVQLKGKGYWREQEAESVASVASRMVTDAKCQTVADLPTPEEIRDAWVEKMNEPGKAAKKLHDVIAALRKMDGCKTSGKYLAVVEAAISKADEVGVKWRKS